MEKKDLGFIKFTTQKQEFKYCVYYKNKQDKKDKRVTLEVRQVKNNDFICIFRFNEQIITNDKVYNDFLEFITRKLKTHTKQEKEKNTCKKCNFVIDPEQEVNTCEC